MRGGGRRGGSREKGEGFADLELGLRCDVVLFGKGGGAEFGGGFAGGGASGSGSTLSGRLWEG